MGAFDFEAVSLNLGRSTVFVVLRRSLSLSKVNLASQSGGAWPGTAVKAMAVLMMPRSVAIKELIAKLDEPDALIGDNISYIVSPTK